MRPMRLPEPREAPLPRSPLTLVVCQVRHDRVLAAADTRRGLDVQARLGAGYPEIEQRRSVAATFAVSGGASAQMSQDQTPAGWQIKSDDGAWTATLDPEFFSIETSAYAGWTDFRTRLDGLVSAVIAAYEPALEARIGLRYVDEIVEPEVTSPTGWKGWIRDELLGPLAHDDIGPSVRATQQIVEFDAGEGYRVVLRHGTSPIAAAPNWVYLLDHDCFRQAGRSLTHDDVLGAADDLHRIALQVFQAAITDRLYKLLETPK